LETTGNSLAVLEKALAAQSSRKKVAYELGWSEAELSKQISALRKSVPLIEYLGLTLVDQEVHRALRLLLREAL